MRKVVNSFILSLVMMLPLFATHDAKYTDHFYVDASMIQITPMGILLNFEGNSYIVNALYSDENGLFISNNSISRELEWCPICQRWREPGHTCSGKN